MSTHNEIFNAFVEAQKALDELPSARAKIDELEHSLSICRETNDHKDSQIEDYAKQVQALQISLAEAKKAADDATFRELQARDHLENLFKVIHGAADTANKAHAELNPPKPEPEVPLAVETTPDSSATSPTSAENTDANSSHSEQGQSVIPPDSTSGGTQTTADTNVTEGQSEANPPSSQPTADTHGSDTMMGQSDSPFASTAAGQSPPVPSDAGSNAAQTTDTGSPAQQSADASQPNFGMPYWTKPAHMTWRQWQAQGNIVPNWINADQLDTH